MPPGTEGGEGDSSRARGSADDGDGLRAVRGCAREILPGAQRRLDPGPMIPSEGMPSVADPSSDLVLVERRARAAFVTLNRADAANALSKGLVAALERAFVGLADDAKR